MIARFLSAVFAVAIALALPAAAWAGGPVNVGVRVIEATQSGAKSIDPKLKPLAKQLMVMPFASYKLVKEPVLKLEAGAPGKVELPGKRTVSLTLKRVDSAKKPATIDINLKMGKKLDTDLSVADGGTFLSVVHNEAGGKAVILAITASSGAPAK